jgi:hypothetical protein
VSAFFIFDEMENELKTQIKQLIDEFSEDEIFLEQVYQILKQKHNPEKNVTQELSTEQLKRLEESLKQADDLKVVSNSKAYQLFAQWLKM